MGQTGDDRDAGWDDGTLNDPEAGKKAKDQNWEVRTAAAAPSYQNQIAKSGDEEAEFETEDGTAVAGNEYVQSIRESAGPSATALETPRAKDSVVAPLGTNAATPVAIAKAANGTPPAKQSSRPDLAAKLAAAGKPAPKAAGTDANATPLRNSPPSGVPVIAPPSKSGRAKTEIGGMESRAPAITPVAGAKTIETPAQVPDASRSTNPLGSKSIAADSGPTRSLSDPAKRPPPDTEQTKSLSPLKPAPQSSRGTVPLGSKSIPMIANAPKVDDDAPTQALPSPPPQRNVRAQTPRAGTELGMSAITRDPSIPPVATAMTEQMPSMRETEPEAQRYQTPVSQPQPNALPQVAPNLGATTPAMAQPQQPQYRAQALNIPPPLMPQSVFAPQPGAYPEAPPQQLAPKPISSRNRILLIAATAIVAMGVGIGVFFLVSSTTEKKPAPRVEPPPTKVQVEAKPEPTEAPATNPSTTPSTTTPSTKPGTTTPSTTTPSATTPSTTTKPGATTPSTTTKPGATTTPGTTPSTTTSTKPATTETKPATTTTPGTTPSTTTSTKPTTTETKPATATPTAETKPATTTTETKPGATTTATKPATKPTTETKPTTTKPTTETKPATTTKSTKPKATKPKPKPAPKPACSGLDCL